MYRVYFKQAIQLLKQNKFISIIAITGTALAIMMVMTLILTEEVKNRSIAPEINRNRTAYIKFFWKATTDKSRGGIMSGYLNYDMYEDYLSSFETPELTSAIIPVDGEQTMVQPEGSKKRFPAGVLRCDANFWHLMSYSFIEGHPFSQADFGDGIRNTVISESFAKKFFGKEPAIGKTITFSKVSYKIIGVVKDVSKAFQFAHADIWIPYTATKSYTASSYHVLYLLKDPNDIAALQEEVKESERRYNLADEEWELIFRGPYNHRLQRFALWSSHEPLLNAHIRKTVLIFTILLLIPAINLSSFSMSRIKRRTEEIGIRKAFGAGRRTILMQVLYENLITSFIGGFIGLALSYGVIFWLKGWLLEVSADSSIPIGALISFPVFLYVVLVCVLLNLISAAIPAYKASRVNIVQSLNQNNL